MATKQANSNFTTREASFRITGTHPLLMHSPASMSLTERNLKTKVIPSPEEEAKASRYVTSKGFLYIPTQGIRNSIASGGKGRRIGKMAATTILRSAMFPAEEQSVLLDPATGKPLTADQYVIDTRRVQLKGRGGTSSVLRSRAMIREWCTDFILELDETIDDDMVIEAGNIAGRLVGICDYRPEKSGPFGRYTIEKLNGNAVAPKAKSK
jgi:hypothetical protein